MTCVLDSCNQGREPYPDPAVCCGRSRRVSDPDLLRQCLASGQADSRQIAAHLAAGDVAEDRDEPMTDPDYMLALTALTGVLAVAFIAGGLIWLVYSILPVLRAHFV